MNEPYLTRFGSFTTYCCMVDGSIYTKLSVILKAFGYITGINPSIKKWLNSSDTKLIRVGKQDAWFINRQGVDTIIANSNYDIPFNTIQYIYKDIFGDDSSSKNGDPYIFKFTATQMMEIYELINETPIKKGKVLERLRSGKFIL